MTVDYEPTASAESPVAEQFVIPPSRMRRVREVARQHPWEFFLLFTIPVVFGAVRMTLALVEAPAWAGFGVSIVYLLVLIAAFPFVRRSGKQLLTLLWLILILDNVYRRVLVVIQNPPGFERTDNLTIVEIAVEIEHGLFTSFVLTASMVGYVVLAVVFMLAATRLGGLRYAFLLLGLLGLEQNFSFNSNLLTLSRHDFVPLWYFAPMSLHLLAQVGINVLMFRALTRLDTRAFTLLILIGGSLLLAVASHVLWAAMVFWPFAYGLYYSPYFSLSLLAVRAIHIVGQTLAIVVLALVLHYALRRPHPPRFTSRPSSEGRGGDDSPLPLGKRAGGEGCARV